MHSNECVTAITPRSNPHEIKIHPSPIRYEKRHAQLRVADSPASLPARGGAHNGMRARGATQELRPCNGRLAERVLELQTKYKIARVSSYRTDDNCVSISRAECDDK